MKIVFDARLIQQTGVGRYIRNILTHIAYIDNKNTYVVLLRKEDYDHFTLPNERWEKRCVDVRWHSISEQIILPFILMKEQADVVHIPYFNVPILYFRKYVTTMHDIIIHHMDTGKASTLPLPLYKLRRFGYNIILRRGLQQARSIIAVSKTTKQELLKHFPLPGKKIEVIYEGIDPLFVKPFMNKKSIIDTPYFLYVGNAYPHKNLSLLLKAFFEFSNKNQTAQLVLVGREDYFYKQLKKEIDSLSLSSRVHVFGEASQEQLLSLYDHALALIAVSKMEGFGFPPLEASVRQIPVICSDIPVFHEILGDMPLYVNPHDAHQIAESFLTILKSPKKYVPSLRIKDQLLKQYNWEHAATETIRLYEASKDNS